MNRCRRGSRSSRGRHRLHLLPLLPLLISSCELTEVTIPSGEPTVIVHAVLSVTQPRQFVLVEQSLTGTGRTSEEPSAIPPGEPRIPVDGATVTLTHGETGGCAEPTVTLESESGTRGVYLTTALCPLAPGDLVQLRVETPDGHVVTGETYVPGAREFAVRTGRDSAQQEFQRLEFHRVRDTLRVGADAILARGLQVEVRDMKNPEDVAIYLFTDTLGVALPGNLVNPFEGDSGETVFPAGREYSLTVAVLDSNYFDFIRSRSDPFTGRGFINHLDGGIGVFGAIEARSYSLRMVDEVDDPREGVYRLQGVALGAEVDVTLEPYFDDLLPGEFSAFVTGTWVEGQYEGSADGFFGIFGPENDFVASFSVAASNPEDPPSVYVLYGTRPAQGQPFTVTLETGDGFFLATLTAVQVSGPDG